MSWHDREDLGTQLVAHVHQSLRIPSDYTRDIERGFEWWASDYAQRIWSDLGNFHNASTVFRLHAEIDFLKAGGHAEAAEIALAEFLGQGSLSAVVFSAEKDLYKLHCSIYADYDNELWIKHVFNAAVALQITEVQRNANRFARDFKMSHPMSEHPIHGSRKAPDPICEFEEKFFKPHGRLDSRWIGAEEWEDSRQALRRLCNDIHTDYKLTLEAQFDWSYGQRDMTLLISAVDTHPELGNGLYFTLTLPILMDDAHKAHVAILLNEHERSEWNWYNDIGSWGLRDGELCFVCFVPNICFTRGILRDFSHDMGLRANWVHEHWPQIVKQEWVAAT